MRRSIAVVDDMPFMLILLKHCLQAAGYDRVDTFYGPGELIESVRQGYAPGLIITDFQMPGLDGVEMLERIGGMLPAMRAIIVSGDPGAVLMSSSRFPILEKGSLDFHKRLVELVHQQTGRPEAVYSS